MHSCLLVMRIFFGIYLFTLNNNNCWKKIVKLFMYQNLKIQFLLLKILKVIQNYSQLNTLIKDLISF